MFQLPFLFLQPNANTAMDMGMNMEVEVEGEGDWARGTGTTDFGHRGFGSGQWMAAIMR